MLMSSDDPRPTVWPPPPTLPEPVPPTPRMLPFGNERLGSLSPLCVTLGLAIALLAQFLIGMAYVGGVLVLVGFTLGLLSWRTLGGKIGLGIVTAPLLLLLVGLLLSL